MNSLDKQKSQATQNKVLRPGEKKLIWETGDTGDESHQPTNNQPQQQDKPSVVPPADIIEKIRVRTEQNDKANVDPFSPVKKQTINQ